MLSQDVEVVVARYEEDPGWVGPLKDNVILYDKKDGVNADVDRAFIDNLRLKRVVRLPNVGREAHTYLYHIVTNYDDLAPITVFVQGCIREHMPLFDLNIVTPADWVVHLAKEARSSPSGLSQNALAHDVNIMGAYYDFTLSEMWPKLKSTNMLFGQWLPWAMEPLYKHHDKNNKNNKNDKNERYRQFPRNEPIKWFMGACFAARRENITQHPRAFYERLLHMLDDHMDPEAGHFMERSWWWFLV